MTTTTNTDTGSELLRLAERIQHLLTRPEFVPGSSARANLENACDALAVAQHAIDQTDQPPPSTCDTTVQIPARALGIIWGDAIARRCNAERQFRPTLGWLISSQQQGQQPLLRDVAAKLLGEVLLSAYKTQEFWAGLWQGPFDVAALDTDDTARAELWETFVDAVWAGWTAKRIEAGEALERQRKRNAANDKLLTKMMKRKP